MLRRRLYCSGGYERGHDRRGEHRGDSGNRRIRTISKTNARFADDPCRKRHQGTHNTSKRTNVTVLSKKRSKHRRLYNGEVMNRVEIREKGVARNALEMKRRGLSPCLR